jgi:hypothetical protein
VVKGVYSKLAGVEGGGEVTYPSIDLCFAGLGHGGREADSRRADDESGFCEEVLDNQVGFISQALLFSVERTDSLAARRQVLAGVCPVGHDVLSIGLSRRSVVSR